MHDGPIPAEITIIVDYREDYGWGVKSVFDKLTKLGIAQSSIFIINLTDTKPPKGDDGAPDVDKWIRTRKTCPGARWEKWENTWISPEFSFGFQQAKQKLAEVNPKLIIALGKAALLFATGQSKIASWRGSRMTTNRFPCTVVPTYHPRILAKQPESRFIIEMDLTRAYNIYTGKQTPRNYSFQIEPSYQQVLNTLLALLARAENGPLVLSGDIETRAGHIACFGIAWSVTEAICIPHLTVHPDQPFYWQDPEQDATIISLYSQLFEHPNIEWVGQNFLYDCQYFHRHWGCMPVKVFDTMIAAHALHSNIKKSLDFLSSMYTHDHVYWKDEIKEWDPEIGEKQYWTYNCKDACITLEIADELKSIANDRTGVAHQHLEFQQKQFFPVLRMMNRGMRWDMEKRKTLKKELLQVVFDREQQLNWIVGYTINAQSPKQLLNLFYNELGIPGIKALGKETLSTNSPTLQEIARRYPMLAPLCQLITELRSLGVFLSNFIDADVDIDDRMRTSFAVAGPTTYRYASRENAFYSGMNMQNIPVKEKQKISGAQNYVKLPNVRELALADPGKTYFDLDLDRADMQIVGWESGDENLKLALRRGVDLHCMSAAEIFRITGIPVDELVESHPNYPEHRARIGKANRDKTKNGGHACDYAVGIPKLAQTLGITRHEAEQFKARWFGLFPGIRKWHLRVEQAVANMGFLENIFGARLYQFGRFNLPEFLGWHPQSTVAGVINRALVKLDAAKQAGETSIELSLQIHDSLAGQFSTAKKEAEIANLQKYTRIIVPYADPLIIPVGIKTSLISWGACK